MSQYNIPSPPNTSDPKRISSYLGLLVDEYLPYMFNNIDEDNLSENILSTLQELAEKVQELTDIVNSIKERL